MSLAWDAPHCVHGVRIADVRTVPCCAGTMSRLLTESTVENVHREPVLQIHALQKKRLSRVAKYDGPSVLLAMPVERRI